MKHWVRDVRWTTVHPYAGTAEWLYLLYHFLRVMGWEWLWECDGARWETTNPDTNHLEDGNMEESGTAKWSAVGTAVVTKVAAQHTGTQALSIASSAIGDGAQSASMLAMQDTRYYRFAIWASNNTGKDWDVEFDAGGGSMVSLGVIPDNGGVPTLYHFESVSAAGGVRALHFLDNADSRGTLIVDAVHCFRSYFEWQPLVDTQTRTDGVVANPDQFSSASYSFVAGDIGKIVILRDLTNAKNTGAYPISAVAGGVATLDLRSLTAALTAATNLHWRLIDLSNAPDPWYMLTPDDDWKSITTPGWGLQSPHSSKWRLFMRSNLNYGSNYKSILIWSAPEDTDFDFSSGVFYASGPSVQNSLILPYIRSSANDLGNRSFMRGPSGAKSAAGAIVSGFVMTDDDGSFIASVARDIDPGTTPNDGGIVVGYLGSDVNHPGIQEFAQLMRKGNHGAGNELGWYDQDHRFMYQGVGFGSDGKAYITAGDVLGYSSSALNPITQSNAGPNPWSGKEWIRPVRLIRDQDGLNNQQSERSVSIGVYQGRVNLPILSTFDNDNYIHFSAGLVWDWMGESLA